VSGFPAINKNVLENMKQDGRFNRRIQLFLDFAAQCLFRSLAEFHTSTQWSIKMLIFHLIITFGDQNPSVVQEHPQRQHPNVVLLHLTAYPLCSIAIVHLF